MKGRAWPILFLFFQAAAGTAHAATRYIGICGTPNSATIAAAVTAAAAGDTLLVCPGIYNEAVTVNKDNLTIRSSTGNRADVTVTNNGIPFSLTGAGTTIKDMTIGSTNNKGIYRGWTASPSAYTFENLAVTAADKGVYIEVSGKVTFTNVDVASSNDDAINLAWGADGAHVFDTVTVSGKKGIYSVNGGATFKDLTVTATDKAIEMNPKYDAVFSNVVVSSSNEAGISLGWVSSGKPLDFSNVNVTAKKRGIYVDVSGKVTFTNVDVTSRDDDAINLGWGSNGAHVFDTVTATGKKYGIRSENGGATFKDIVATATDNDAIYIMPKYDATFTNVTAMSYGGDGIRMGWVSSGKTLTLSNLNVSAKNRGLYVDVSANLSIRDSYLSSSNGNAIELGYGAEGAHVLESLTLDAPNDSGIKFGAKVPSSTIRNVCVDSSKYGVWLSTWNAKNVSIGNSKFTSSINGARIEADPAYKASVANSCILKPTTPRAYSNSTAHIFNGNYWQGVAGGTSYTDGNVRDNNTLASCPVTSCYASPPLAPVAHYTFDDTWGGSDPLDDFSGNNKHATLTGTVAQELAPAAGAKPDTCKAGNFNKAGFFTTAASRDIDIAANGKNSVSFWMYWDGGFSSSNFTMPFSWGGVYYDLAVSKYRAEMGNGVIGFNTGNGDVYGVTADGLANGWHHVVAVFNNGDVTQNKLYIDGVQKTLRSFGSHSTRSATRSAGIGAGVGWGGDYKWSGKLDSLKIFKGEIRASQIASDMAETAGPCGAVGPDHYELSLPTAGIACASVTATVTACADATSPCANKLAAVAGKTATLAASAGTLSATSVTFDATGVATATLSHPAATNGAAVTVTLSGEEVAASNPRKCCPDGANCVVRDNCSVTFNTAGLIISDSATGGTVTPATQISGKTSGQHYLRAVKTNTTTMACEATISGNRQVPMRYTCVDPDTCTGSGDWMTVAGTSFGSGGGTPTLNFDAATGAAPFTFRYDDAGKITLAAGPVTADNGATLAGATTGAFVVKPAGLCVYSTDLSPCAAADATCPKAKKAGEAFNLTVAAVRDGYDCAPPDTYRTPNYKATGIVLGSELVAPSGGSAGSVGVSSMDIDANGWSSVNQTISEVGVFRFTATPPTYFGETVGEPPFKSGTLGRFTPDHFAIVPETPAPACGTFTYFAQDGVSTPFTLTAQNAANGTTANYAGDFARLDLADWSKFGFTATGMPAGSTLAASATAPTGTWAGGEADVVAKHRIGRPTSLAGATPVTVSAQPTDTDGVTTASKVDIATDTPLRYGRLKLSNANGSEGLALSVPAAAEYWSGSYWQINAADTCTGAALSVPAEKTASPNGTAGIYFTAEHGTCGTESAARHNCLSPTEISANLLPWSNGAGGLSFAAPGNGNKGWLDILLAAPDHLKWDWGACLGQTGDNNSPCARATFGVAGMRVKVLYQSFR